METLTVTHHAFTLDVLVCNFLAVSLNRKHVYVFETKMETFEKERTKKTLKFKVKRGFIKLTHFIRRMLPGEY